MIDVIIMFTGLLCASLVGCLCVFEYEGFGSQSTVGQYLRHQLRNHVSLHAVVLGLVLVSAVSATFVATQYAEHPAVAEYAALESNPAVEALSVVAE